MGLSPARAYAAVMHWSTGERWIALAAVVAALAPAARGALEATIVFVPQTWLVTGAVLGGLGAVVVLVAAWRTRARATVTFALAALLYAVSWPVPGIVGSFVALVAVVLLLAFGVQVVRGSSGFRRALGWIVALGGGLLVVAHFALSWFAPLAAVSQAALNVIVLAPGVVQAVAYAAAAVLFLPPLLRPVRDVARTLWSTVEVR